MTETASKTVRVENKVFFVDSGSNEHGSFIRITEKRGTQRNTLILPVSGVNALSAALQAMNLPSSETPISSRKSTPSSIPATPSKFIFVRNLPFVITEADVTAHMSSAGQVISCVLNTRQGKREVICTGTAVVEFESIASAENAINTLNGTMLGTRSIGVRFNKDKSMVAVDEITALPTVAAVIKEEKAQKKPKPVAVKGILAPTKVFVSNLPLSITEEEVNEFCQGVGKIATVHVMKSNDKAKSAAAVVEFEHEGSAVRAIDQLNQEDLQGNTVGVREYYEK